MFFQIGKKREYFIDLQSIVYFYVIEIRTLNPTLDQAFGMSSQRCLTSRMTEKRRSAG
jgi:hypothetical protein